MKVIFDTNIWISFLIGKQLSQLKPLLSSGAITLILSSALLDEINEVASRPHLKKYFKEDKVHALLQFMENIGDTFNPAPVNSLCRDEKDNFLLDLIEVSNADFLVTGDKDLLELRTFKSASILTVAQFLARMVSISG